MKRTARMPWSDRILGLCALVVVAMVPFVIKATPSKVPLILTIAFLVGLTVGIVYLNIWNFYIRATIDPQSVRLYNFRAKGRINVPLDEVIGYRMDKEGEWWVDTVDRQVQVAVREPWELHRGFAEFAPKKLNGKLKRFPPEAPRGEFKGLWTFDVDTLASEVIFRILAGILIVAAFRHASWALIGQIIGPLLVALVKIWSRLDVTDVGLTLRGPLSRSSIAWEDAKVIFCEKRRRRSFVVMSRDAAIEIPAHLAIDYELMQKVMYSLPKPVFCVNFDETTIRGYRRRKTKKKEAKMRELLPALTD